MTVSNLTPLEDLYRKTEITTRIRYIAAHRLQSHHYHSQWTITLISVALILIPLFQAMEVPLGYSDNFLNAISVFLATLILAYSLLLGSENYQLKADKMLNCGLELGRLSRELALHVSDNSPDTYKKFSEKYHDILEKYDNHEDIDFDSYKLKLHPRYYPNNRQKLLYWAITRTKYRIYFLHYYLAFGLVIAFLWLLVSPST